MTDHSTFASPNEFHIGEMIQFNSELYVVLNETMYPDHFAYRVAAIQWDFNAGKFDTRIHRFSLPGHETYRVFGATVRKTFGLSEKPYASRAWIQNPVDVPAEIRVDWHNDPMHNQLP